MPWVVLLCKMHVESKNLTYVEYLKANVIKMRVSQHGVNNLWNVTLQGWMSHRSLCVSSFPVEHEVLHVTHWNLFTAKEMRAGTHFSQHVQWYLNSFMPPWEVFCSHPTWRRPLGWPRTLWRDYVSSVISPGRATELKIECKHFCGAWS